VELKETFCVLSDSTLEEGRMNKIVEAVIRNGDQVVPVGLVSVKQALEMPEKQLMVFSHPAYEAGKTNIFVSRETLSKLM
jgi:hypothetical protein